jgi:hypothetical protein
MNSVPKLNLLVSGGLVFGWLDLLITLKELRSKGLVASSNTCPPLSLRQQGWRLLKQERWTLFSSGALLAIKVYGGSKLRFAQRVYTHGKNAWTISRFCRKAWDRHPPAS